MIHGRRPTALAKRLNITDTLLTMACREATNSELAKKSRVAP
ncbi:hypothetical protein [Enterococcus phage vB_EfKS5]|nr:hypothetical protein [Enterococcus phage vB_EfKS5]